MIGGGNFEEAFQRGMEEARAAMEDGQVYMVDIQQMHDFGVHSLDLPPVEPDHLAKLGYDLNRSSSPPTVLANQGSAPPNGPASTTNTAAQLAGRWVFQGNINGASVQIATVLSANGQYATYMKMSLANGYTNEAEETGDYTVQGNVLSIRPHTGTLPADRPFELRGDTLLIRFQEWGTVITFQRV